MIWTAPPGPAELRAALAQVEPAKVCLFGRDPGADTPEAFIRRLTGLVKHALNTRGGRAPIGPLAAATAQREATVRLGLAWLAARGHVRIVEETNGEIQLAAGDGLSAPEADFKALDARLRAALAETAAYRATSGRRTPQLWCGGERTHSPITCTTSFLARGVVSKSRKTICCHVPSVSRPATNGTVSDGPTSAARMCALPLSSPQRR